MFEKKEENVRDVQAAVTIALILIPQAIGYSELASINPFRAMLSAVYPLFFYALVGGSVKHLSIGPDPLTSLLVGIGVTKELRLDPSLNPDTIATTLTFLVGIFAIIMSILRMKFLDSILAGYLLTAFIVVVSALIIMQQIPLLTAYKKAQASRSLFFMIINEFESIPRASKTTTIFGFSALAFLITAKCLKLRFQKSQSWDSSFLKSFQNSLV